MMAATPNQYSQPPTAFNSYHRSSPLETLVRRTSSRRKPPSAVDVPTANGLNQQFSYPAREPSSSPERNVSTPPKELLAARQTQKTHHLSPSSPLLHSHFSRGSVATTSSRDDNSFIDFSTNASDQRYEDGYRYFDNESVRSSNTGVSAPALRDSWETSRAHPDSYIVQASPFVRRHDYSDQATPQQYEDHYAAYDIPGNDEPASPVPVVVVSSPNLEPSSVASQGRAPIVGRAPVVHPSASNFSRPVRPLVSDDELERRKIVVLQRNARQQRIGSPSFSQMSGSPVNSMYSSGPSQSPPQPINARSNSRQSPEPRRAPPPPPSRSPSPASTIHSPTSDPPSGVRPDTIHLHRKPPSIRAGSPASIYSDYSYYQLDGSTSSPTGSSHFPDVRKSPSPQFSRSASSPSLAPPVPNRAAPSPEPAAINNDAPTKPEEFLQLGITHHEANRLSDSAACFEKSATLAGGSGVGMLMWGLTLRHGWGCKKDERTGFSWLRKAAELAVADLERKEGVAAKESVKGELVLAIYEVGQCFFHGWGVAKDQKMAVSYYTTAAQLGDPDAQNDLGFCLANGKGCKKDRKEAAKWYRKAVEQGQSDIGLAWIYKEKFQ